jgi:glycosidase
MRSLFIFIFISFFIVVSICLTEIYLRYLGLGDPVRYDSNYIYGYAPKENQKKERLRESIVTINELGLRTPFSWNNSEKKKIIFIGDSITYGGSYIDDEEIFSFLVCSKMNNYLCGNAGVNAYSVINMVMRSRYDRRINNAEVYIFTVAPGDFYREYAGSNTAHFYLNKKEFFLPAITEAISFVTTKYDINNYISKKNDTNTYNNKIDLIDYSFELLKSEIYRLYSDNKKVRLFYTVEKEDKNSEKEINKYILNKLSKSNIPNFYTLEKVLSKDEYFYDSVHYNKKGHLIVAEKILSTF